MSAYSLHLAILGLLPPGQHFPKTERYVALFPEGTYVAPSQTPEDADETGQKRCSLRADIKQRMADGHLNAEPDVELKQRKEERRDVNQEGVEAASHSENEHEHEKSDGAAQVPTWGTKWKAWQDASQQPKGPGFAEDIPAEDDDFFEAA